MLAKAYSATPRGVDALFVTVEVDRIRATQPSVRVVGLPDPAVREAKERIFSAIRHLGRRSEAANTVFNLAPADERKEGAALDLPMALAFLASAGHLPKDRLEDRLLVGELSLEGKLQPVRGVLPIVLAARRQGVGEVILPQSNLAEGSVVSGIRVVGAATLGEVVRYLRDGKKPVVDEIDESVGRAMDDVADEINRRIRRDLEATQAQVAVCTLVRIALDAPKSESAEDAQRRPQRTQHTTEESRDHQIQTDERQDDEPDYPSGDVHLVVAED